MKKEANTELLMGFLASESFRANPELIKTFVAENPQCLQVWEEIREEWELLGEQQIEVPVMPDRFHDLDLQQAERSSSSKTIAIELPRWSLAAATLLLGLVVGLLWPRTDRSDEISQLTEELKKTRLSMQVLYLQSSDAGERMYAASLVEQQPLTEITTEAWLVVLQEDPSLSVRMAALDVLTRKQISPSLRKRLILAMEVQDSPMLRIEMAELAQTHNWKEAIPILKLWQKDVHSPLPLINALQKVISRLNLNV